MTNQSDVYFIKSLLEETGIQAEIFDENISRIAPHYSLIVGGPRVVVQEKDAALAKELIQDYLKNTSIKKTENSPDQQERCPHCKSNAVSAKKRSFLLPSLIVSLIFFLPVPIMKHFYQCNDCGQRWHGK